MSREKLAALERLQTVDLEIEALTRQAGEVPARLAELEGRAAQARATTDAARSRLADNERARHRTETQLGDEREKVKKWESRLPQLKHPREFAALQREVEAAKRNNIAAEEELTRLKAEAEELKRAFTQAERAQAERDGELERERGGLQGQLDSHNGQLSELQQKRAEAKAAVDQKLLGLYELVRKKRTGKVVVPIANGSCTGCNRRLPPPMVHKLMVGAVEACPACMRIMYFPPEPAQH